MKELNNCVVETLVEDDELVISRVRTNDGSSSRLLASLATDRPAAGWAKLQHTHALRGELDFPGAARPLELTEFRGRPALLIEDPGGHFLNELLGRPLTVPEFLRLAIGIATALGGLHRRGLVHKDVKPANLIVNMRTGAAWLTGFGITSRLSRHRQLPEPPEQIAGTLAYMAPEQTGRMGRSIDSRSDLYSLGVTLYEMLVGAPPFTAGDPMEWVHCHIARPPVLPKARGSDIPEPLAAIVMKLLAKAPEDRYQTAAGVAVDLRRCLAAWEADGRIEPFSLGANDMPDQLLIPEKLYGREREVERLLAAFDRVVSQGTTELVLVAGYSGIGKSSVVNELQKALVPPRGLFASGKFDQFQRDIPYATITQAFRKLVDYVLSRSDSEMVYWRDSLRDALGQNGQLIANLIPELEIVTGKQLPVPELPPQEAQSRFQAIFRRFLGVFARPEHPLAIFLDDLQWLDAATLRLLEHLITEPDVRHLLLVGAYRDNEVGPSHPLTRTVKTMRGAGATVQQMALAPLAPDDVVQLVADSLHCGQESARPLAHLIYEKAGGNPFFLNQFITTLAEEGLLAFDPEAGAWQWDLPRIEAKGFTDNVIDLMAGKLDRLPEGTQNAMSLLACLGSAVEAADLALIYGESEEALHAALWEAMRGGLVLRSDTVYAFLHDRVQEAAYKLIPVDERAEVHLRIGRLLASQTATSEIKEKIFEFVNQFNRGIALLHLPAERDQVAEFNLEAGRRAKISAAYASALTYLTTGRALVGASGWERKYRLTFDLEFHRAECEILTGDLPAAEERLTMLSRKAKSVPDSASIARLRADLYTNMDQPKRAVEIGLEYLRLVDVTWSAHPTDGEVSEEYARIWRQLGSRPVEELLELPPMTDTICRVTLDVLTSVHAPANFIDGNLVSLIIGRMANLSLEHGNAAGSCFAYVYLGMILESRFGDYRRGVSFGKLGANLLEKEGLDRFRARVYNNFGMAINPWASHVRSSVELLRRANDAAREAGDLTFIGYSYTNLISALLIAGDPLSDVQRETETALAFVRRAQFGTVADMLVVQLSLIRALRGLTNDPSSFNHAEFEESQFERHLEEDPGLAMPACWYWIRKMQACYLSGALAPAVAAATRAEALLWTSPNFIVVVDHHFYAALVRLAEYNEAPAGQRDRIWTLSERHRKMLAVWAEHCPENFADRAALVEAEVARIEDRPLDAMRLYEQAIQSARTHGFPQNEALIHEVAAHFYAARGFETIALAYLREARSCYLRWGAKGKVRQLEERHPRLREDRMPGGSIGASEPQVEDLDLLALAKSAEAVSEEIVLSKLIGMLMTLAVECAGAERGLLILLKNEKPLIEAEAITREGKLEVTRWEVAVTPEELPISVLQFTMRTRQSVILNDAAVRHAYSEDDYVRRKRPRSVLCLPIVKQTKLMGVLYLENNLAPHVFTVGRVSVLNLLASRAAISLENARLYADLERENAERKRVEEELRRSERLMAEGQRIGRTGSWAWNIKTGKLTWSEEQKRIFGFPSDREELIFEDFAGTIHPEDRSTTLQTVDEAARVGRSFDQEFRIVLPDGAIKFIHGSGRPVFDESGALVEYFGAIADITEQQKTEAELERALARVTESKDQLRTLINTIPSHAWMADSSGMCEFFSRRWLEYAGMSLEEAQGEGWTKTIHPHDLGAVQEVWQRILVFKIPGEVEARMRRFDGEYRWYFFRAAPLINPSGEVVKWYGTNVDIEDRKQAEEKIRASEESLRMIVESIPGMVSTCTGQGELDIVSNQIQEFLGRSPEEMEDWLSSVHPDDRERLISKWTRSQETGEPLEDEQRLLRYDGQYRWFHSRSHPLKDERGQVIRWYNLLIDIHDRRMADDELRRSKVFLERAQKLSQTGSTNLRVSDGRLSWSEETARIYGYDPAIPPTPEMVLQRVHPEDVDFLKAVFARAMQGGASFQFDHRLLMPDGSIKYIRNFADSIKVEDGHEEVIGAVQDVTAQYVGKAALEEALAKIKKSEDQLRTLIDTIPCHAWTASPNGEGEFFSRQWLEYAGMSMQEVQGAGWANAIHPDDVGPHVETWQRILASKRPGQVESRMRRYDGTYRWYLFRGAPLLDQSGEIVKWYGTNVDIDGLKRAETFLAGEKRLFEMIAKGEPLESTLRALCEVVEDLADGALASILLMDDEGRCLRHCAAPSLPASYTKAVDGGLIGPSVGSCGTAAYRGEGVYVSDIATDPRWVDYRDLALQHDLRACWSSPIFSSDGSVLGTFAIYSRQAREITPDEIRITEQFTHLASIVVERKRAEDALLKSEAFLAEGQRISHTGSWAWNLATDKVVWSDEHCRIFGYRPEEVGGTFAGVLARMLPDEREHLREAVGEAVRRGEDFHIDHKTTLSNGSTKRLHSVGRVIVNSAGEPVEYIGTTMDITESKRVEDELRQSEAHLRKVQAELAHVARTTTMGELAASIAHEVSQPLTGVVTNANASLRWLAADTPNLDEARGSIQRVLRDGKRAGDVISRIRKLFRKEASTKEQLDINEVIQEVIVLTRSELEKNDIALRLRLAADITPVLGDRVQLQQVLMNLILNAIDAMSSIESSARELSITTVGEDFDQVRVEVRDTGVGITPENAERVFEPFHTSKAGGLGMGLPICRTIVEEHGGQLCVVSHEDPGARFQFTLVKQTTKIS